MAFTCLKYAKLFWYDDELFTCSVLCSVPWFVIGDMFFNIKDTMKSLKSISNPNGDFCQIMMQNCKFIKFPNMTFLTDE